MAIKLIKNQKQLDNTAVWKDGKPDILVALKH